MYNKKKSQKIHRGRYTVPKSRNNNIKGKDTSNQWQNPEVD